MAAVVYLLLPRGPAEVPLQLHLGARGAELRRVELKFERGETIARDLSLDFPAGAPADLERTVRLRPGDYTIAVRLVDGGGREARDSRAVKVEPGDPLSIDLAFLR